MTNPDDLLTSAEAGRIIDRSARTIQRLIEAGTLPCVRQLPGPNGPYLIRRSDVEALLTSERRAG